MPWNKESTDQLITLWGEANDLERIAIEMDTGIVNVRNKLVRLGLYKKAEKKSVVTKKALVREIERELGFSMITLVSVNKEELWKLRNWLLDEDF